MIVPNFVIDNELQLERFLSDIAREAIRELKRDSADEERQIQNLKADELAGLKNRQGANDVEEADDDSEAVDDASDQSTQTQQQSNTKGKIDKASEIASKVPKVTRKKLKQASLNDIIKMLNVLRSGRSLKDRGTQQKMQDYIGGLESGEKETLYAFITGLAEIMVAGETGEDALDPEDVGITINVRTEPKSKQQRPSLSNKPQQKGTPDAPIVVGEQANKSAIRHKLRELMER